MWGPPDWISWLRGFVFGFKRAPDRARVYTRKQKRVKDLIDRYDVLAVLVASVLPPPFPSNCLCFRGYFAELMRFTIAIAAGRTFRYLLEGYLAARYGEHAEILQHYYQSIESDWQW